MPHPQTPAKVATKLIMVAAASAFCASAAASIGTPEEMELAQEQFRDGAIWVWGRTTLICITGALGGSFFSVGFELYRLKQRRMNCKRPTQDEVDEFLTTRLALKFLMQPVLAIVVTFPLLRCLPIQFNEESILLVSFVVGSCGVWFVNLVAPWTEKSFLPAVGAALVGIVPAIIAGLTRRAVPEVKDSDFAPPYHPPAPEPVPVPLPEPEPEIDNPPPKPRRKPKRKPKRKTP
jgi:hypothetical protein